MAGEAVPPGGDGGSRCGERTSEHVASRVELVEHVGRQRGSLGYALAVQPGGVVTPARRSQRRTVAPGRPSRAATVRQPCPAALAASAAPMVWALSP